VCKISLLMAKKKVAYFFRQPIFLKKLFQHYLEGVFIVIAFVESVVAAGAADGC
jgi:hypothetical protein